MLPCYTPFADQIIIFPVRPGSSIRDSSKARRFNSTKNTAFYFLGILATTMFVLTVTSLKVEGRVPEKPANVRDSWTGTNDRYWTVAYNSTEGSIHVNVLAYDREYGPGNEDGFLDYAHLQYSLDGANFTDFYYIDYNSGPVKQDVSVRGGVSTSASSTDDGRNIKWNIRLNLTNALQKITAIRIVGNWDVGGSYTSDDVKADKSVAITQLSSINSPAYEFTSTQVNGVNSAKVRVTCSKGVLNEADNQSRMQLYYSSGVPAITETYKTTLGNYGDVAISNSEQTYYWLESAYDGRISIASANLKVPAFTLPKTASASYDVSKHTVTFSWTIDPVPSGSFVNDKFKIQQADNEEFNGAKEVSVEYDASKAAYTYTVTSNLNPNMYFRVARNHTGTNWGAWDLFKSAGVTVPFVSLAQKLVKLSLDTNNVALLQWSPAQNAWLPNASFVITRVNNSSKTETSIKLGKADFDLGSYTDNQLSICNEYTYKLQVIPPDNTGFTAFAPVQAAGSILPTKIGRIANLIASKGYFADRTKLQWSSVGTFDNFIVKRAEYGTNKYAQLNSVQGSSTGDYQTDDSKGTPGIYYTYMVVGVVNCNNVPIYSKDTLYAIGFRSPTGNVYGRITFDNGQAVENAFVRLQRSDSVRTGQSIFLNGNTASYLKIDSLNTPFADTALTVEAWIKPVDVLPKDQVIFSRSTQYELGFNHIGQLYFTYNGKTVSGNYSNPSQLFIHIAGVHRKDSLSILVNGSLVAAIPASFKSWDVKEKNVFIGRNKDGNNFKGFIDEMRVWNIALSQARVARDYTRMLTGGEVGLVAYWRFDETIKDQFYDVSHNNDFYNQNDGIMNASYVSRSTIIPTTDQLSLKTYTDASGNYLISSIPFSGSGTSYTIVPLLGTHQFDPKSVDRLFSASSTEFTVDFKDRSAFSVSGYVYYNNGTVPAGGVRFKIDGQYAQRNNGDVIETDATGLFTISVPVGSHEVQAFKTNHVFVNNGRITDRFGRNLNYQSDIGPLILFDSTLIRFTGRVAGGAIQDVYPLGHSLSVNNLGKELSISMSLPSGGKYELHSGKDSVALLKHRLPSDSKASQIQHKSRVLYAKNSITIYPDSLTGEFIADLIPEKFNVDNVMATGWGDLLEGKPVLVNFSDKSAIQHSIYNYQDSSKSASDKWSYSNYSDTVDFNDAYKFIKRVTPSVSITQVDNGGAELAYFGNSMYEAVSASGKKDSIPVIDAAQKAGAAYVFGNPVFKQNQAYQFNIKAFEEYPFYTSVKPDGTPVAAQKNGKDVISRVPTQDGKVSILNKIRNGATVEDTLSLSTSGVGIYQFVAGDPDIAAPALKSFSASIQFGQAVNVSWNWLGNQQMKVYVAGGKLTGTDFITAGPDNLMMILRDPPGSRSYSFAERGTTFTKTTSYTGSADQVGDNDFEIQLGEKLVTFEGVGFGVISTPIDVTDNSGFGIHHEEHYTYGRTKSYTNTLTTRFQTSDAPYFVGAPADLFVGYSTNITYGQSNNITLIRRSDLKATDTKIFEADPASIYLVVARSGINIGEKFGTMFAFPQQHIEKVLIPNLISIRNGLLLPPTTTSTEAQGAADFGKKQVYVSKLAGDNVNFGKSNNDTTAFGMAAKNDPFDDGRSYKIYFPATSAYRTDTIMTLNQYVSSWQKRMADNEKAKLNSSLFQNYSFHAGTPIQYTDQTSEDVTTTNSFNIVLAGSVTHSTDVSIFGNGFVYKLNESIGTTQGGDFGNTNSTSKTLGFMMASDGTDDYFTIDVNRDTDGTFAFRTKGGVSACPYEGATITKYYQPGTVIDQPTQRIEVPVITVDKAVVSNVPSANKASYTLTLRNQSEAKLPATFILGYVDNDSIRGATIAVDGTPIGGTGRAVVVQYGETVTKVLTLAKGPNAMDYNNIKILLHSSCQYDPTSYQETIGDTVLVSAHFIPSCSEVHIKSPADKWVLNLASPVNGQGKRFLPVTIDQFDVTNSLFDHIELQYKASSGSTWNTVTSFYSDSIKFKAAQGDKQFITNAQGINYNLVMDDASFNDQNFDVQAVSVCLLGPGNFVTTNSNLVSGIKDTYAPRLFGTPQPANGILGISDEIRLNFNEPIAAGLLTTSNFQVTGTRNGAPGDHTVSVNLDGQSNYIASEFDKNLTGKKITAEMWVLPNAVANGTLFSHGNLNLSMELALTGDNRLQVIMGGNVATSNKALDSKQGEWAHVALVYDYVTSTVSAFYNFVEVIHSVVVDKYTGLGHFEFGRSVSKQGNYFGGKIHEARIWTDALTPTALQVNSLTRYSGNEHGLMAYYPMNEGKGNIAFDKSQGSNATIVGNWTTPAGKAILFNGNGYVKMNTATAPVLPGMDYTIELWFKAAPGQTNAALVSNGKGDGTDFGGSYNMFTLGFENGLITFENNGFKVQSDGNYLDNNWHHLALTVNRNSGTAQVFVDGLLRKYFDPKNLGGIAAGYTFLGARALADSTTTIKFDRYFKGSVDELRIWNTYLNQTLISNNNNTKLNGNEIGLMAYYPFEKYFDYQNRKELGFTLSDMKVQQYAGVIVPDATASAGSESNDMAPVKDRGPVDNLRFDYVVNNSGLIITMLEPKQSIDKTIITFKAKDMRDLNGNAIASPITWTAYIDQNQLKWSDNNLVLSKDVNAPMKIETYLLNNGGSLQHFRLDNMPAWLTPDISSGTIDPKGRLKITFTVNEGLNIGVYDEIIYMRNDNNESEALSILMSVKGKQPDWKVNAADYNYSMIIYGKIRINSIFSSNKADMLAAFKDGKCVGITTNTYSANSGLWYAFMSVYGDSLNSGNLEFRIWEANSGKTYLATPLTPIAFANNAIIGTSGNPIIFDGKEIILQDITLTKNWNWISFNVANQVANNLPVVLAGGKWQSGDIVKNEDSQSSQYAKNTGWSGDLKSFNNTSFFMLSAGQAQTFSTSGAFIDVKKTPIPLKGNRWNYISYLPPVTMTVKDALAGYNASNDDIIKSQTGFAMYDGRNGWVGNLTFLEPGKGYMLYRQASGDTSFLYPVISGNLTNHREIATGNPNYGQTPVQNNFNFAGNMTIVAMVGKQFPTQTGDIIHAYVGTELRGKSTLGYNTTSNNAEVFLNIAGDRSEAIGFKLERNGDIIAAADTLVKYASNGKYGTVGNPVILSFSKVVASTGQGLNVYPNPFSKNVFINVDLPVTSLVIPNEIQVSVYDINGQLIMKRAKEYVSTGPYQTTWNGKTSNGTECRPGVYFINVNVNGVLQAYKIVKFN